LKKRYLIITGFFFISVFFSCQKPESVPANCNYSQQTYDSLHIDALYLYVNEIYTDSLHPNRNQPEINQAPVKRILGQFQAILDLQIPEVDTVFDILHIRSCIANTRYLWMKVDPDAPEIQALINGQATGNPTLDGIIDQYHFTEVETAYSYPSFNWISIHSSTDWNLIPIANQLEGLVFIDLIDSINGLTFDGSYVQKTNYPAYTEYDFVYGWEDCPSGCLHKRHWIFQVNNTTCEADFSDAFGDVLPTQIIE